MTRLGRWCFTIDEDLLLVALEDHDPCRIPVIRLRRRRVL